MRNLDETDLRILRLLVEDARRPYSEIAERVGVSPPTVSDRVDRLYDLGVIRRFTLDLDRSKLSSGVAVVLDLRVAPDSVDDVASGLAAERAVEHVFATADAHVIARATVAEGDVRSLLEESVGLDPVVDYDVRLLEEDRWRPGIGDTDLALECAECGNTVTSEGETTEIDGKRYHFCCGSCRSNFEEQYEALKESA